MLFSPILSFLFPRRVRISARSLCVTSRLRDYRIRYVWRLEMEGLAFKDRGPAFEDGRFGVEVFFSLSVAFSPALFLLPALLISAAFCR